MVQDGHCPPPQEEAKREGRLCFFLRVLCHFELNFVFGVRILFSVRESRPLWETLYRYHE